MVKRDDVTSLVGKQVSCHTHFGVFHGVIVHCTEEHVILAPMFAHHVHAGPAPYPIHIRADDAQGRWGPGGYGPGPGGPGPGGPGGPGGGGGWHIAVPLAAIIGVTAIGLHWF
ncbi:hypothetical protein [Alicyclobacillus sp. ALC3]|uniref:hypothetical protein n=1 Tax=Alicyclobacillus sp. ALC3 TaxID=2796143 RepID=UPI00237A05FC|nr:hypothetical protein [Alicyclobacillus sp. ALC3]WDL97973.1 hypothetical protein JC200_04475 [Alicyclobacillus sp. ALC3]